MSERVQRKRSKGWKIPPNTIYVGRPSKWGNPWKASATKGSAREEILVAYRTWLDEQLFYGKLDLKELLGKDLACWCPLTDKNGDKVSCHADILLEYLSR